jgi:hypothetical protein
MMSVVVGTDGNLIFDSDIRTTCSTCSVFLVLPGRGVVERGLFDTIEQ